MSTRYRTAAAVRAWLRRHHAAANQIVVRLCKTHVVPRGLTYAEALDEALSVGRIDGVRRRLDDESYSIRFTPRKPNSVWSRVNLAHIERLSAAGRMTPAGMAAYRARTEERTGLYSFERAAMRLSPEAARRFRSEKAAWDDFQSEAPWYRRTSTFWVMSAKREETRARRLELLIRSSRAGDRIPPLISGAASPRRAIRGQARG